MATAQGKFEQMLVTRHEGGQNAGTYGTSIAPCWRTEFIRSLVGFRPHRVLYAARAGVHSGRSGLVGS